MEAANKREGTRPTYEDTHANQLLTAGTIEIRGVPLEMTSKLIKGRIPVQHCICVQDTPENPCPCSGRILWLPEIGVLAREMTGRRDAQGREIASFRVSGATEILVESVDISRADRLGATMQHNKWDPPDIQKGSISGDVVSGVIAVFVVRGIDWTIENHGIGKAIDALYEWIYGDPPRK